MGLPQKLKHPLNVPLAALVVGVVAFVGGGGWILAQSDRFDRTEEGVTVRVIGVETGERVEEKITAQDGILRLGDQRVLESPVAGTVEKIFVAAGDRAEANQPLIQIQDSQARATLDNLTQSLERKRQEIHQARTALQWAQTRLQEQEQRYQRQYPLLTTGDRQTLGDLAWEVEKARVALAQKQRDLDLQTQQLAELQTTLAQDRQLFADGFYSEMKVRDREKQLTQAALALQVAREQLQIQAREVQRKTQAYEQQQRAIAAGQGESQRQLQELQGALDHSRQQWRSHQSQLQNLQQNYQDLLLEQQRVQRELDQKLVVAPTAGLVLHIAVTENQLLQEQSPLITMGNPQVEVVDFNLLPSDAPLVAVGDKIKMTPMGPDAQTYFGTVDQISLLVSGEENNGSGDRGEGMVKGRAILDQPLSGITPNSRVKVDIILSAAAEAIAVNSAAIMEDEGGKTYVWLLGDGNFPQRRDVTVGVEGLETTEILSGLSPGDPVLLPILGETIQGDQMVKVVD